MTQIKLSDADGKGNVGTLDLASNTVTLTDETGRLVTLDLGPADVHIETGLVNYCAGYKLQGSIADEVSPIVPTPKASDKYWTYDKLDAFQDVEALVSGASDAPNEVSPRLANTLFTTVPYALAAAVPLELIANADAPVRPEIAAMRRIMNAMQLARERRVAAKVMTAGNWTSRTAAVAAKWNGGANSNPVADLYTAVESCLGPDVNQIVMSERTFHDFIQNAQVQKYFAAKDTFAPFLMNADAPDTLKLPGLPKIVIGKMKGVVTDTSTFGYVWGNNVLLAYNEPGVPADGTTINVSKTFRWTGANGATPDGTMQGGFMVRKYFDPRRGARGAYVYVVVVNDIEVITSTYAGYLLTGAHA